MDPVTAAAACPNPSAPVPCGSGCISYGQCCLSDPSQGEQCPSPTVCTADGAPCCECAHGAAHLGGLSALGGVLILGPLTPPWPCSARAALGTNPTPPATLHPTQPAPPPRSPTAPAPASPPTPVAPATPQRARCSARWCRRATPAAHARLLPTKFAASRTPSSSRWTTVAPPPRLPAPASPAGSQSTRGMPTWLRPTSPLTWLRSPCECFCLVGRDGACLVGPRPVGHRCLGIGSDACTTTAGHHQAPSQVPTLCVLPLSGRLGWLLQSSHVLCQRSLSHQVSARSAPRMAGEERNNCTGRRECRKPVGAALKREGSGGWCLRSSMAQSALP